MLTHQTVYRFIHNTHHCERSTSYTALMDSVLSDNKWWNIVFLLLVVAKISKLKKSQDADGFSQEQNADPPVLWSCTSATETQVTLSFEDFPLQPLTATHANYVLCNI